MTKTQGWILVVGLLVIVALGVAAVVGLIGRPIGAVSDLAGSAATEAAKILHPTPTIYPDPVTVVREVQALARLETVQYTIEKVITAESGQGAFGFLFGDKLLLVAHGTVIAGLDLSKIQSGDVRVDPEGTVLLVLPPAEIFSNALDNSKTYVYHRESSLLAPSQKDLETQARQAAEEEIRKAAIEDGILESAMTNGKAYLERLMISLRFRKVAFLTATPTPEGTPPSTPTPGK